MFQQLPFDILINISKFLSNQDILNLSRCCKYYHELVYRVRFSEKVDYQDIIELPYFDSFINITCKDNVTLFPKFLKDLHWKCDVALPEDLPNTLIHLTFSAYNKPLLKLPCTLIKLSFGRIYNQPLPILPDKLTHLYFGYRHNMLNPFKYMDCASDYNQPLPNIPESLLHLVFGSDYNQPLPSELPDSITHLKFGLEYNQPLPNLPNSLIFLSFGQGSYNHLLPVGIFDRNGYNHSGEPQLPDSLTILEFGYAYNKSLPNLPRALMKLKFGYYYNQLLPDLPNTLTHLTFGRHYNQPLPDLPESLTHLIFNIGYKQPLISIPKSLKYLKIKKGVPIPKNLPLGMRLSRC